MAIADTFRRLFRKRPQIVHVSPENAPIGSRIMMRYLWGDKPSYSVVVIVLGFSQSGKTAHFKGANMEAWCLCENTELLDMLPPSSLEEVKA
jgi:hypothetical protein